MVKVIEVAQIVAGPTAGLILSDLGFEVIKVEPPGRGDISRHLKKSSSGAFPFYNRNKKSLSLDLKKGKEIFLKLIKDADILIDNLAAGSMERLGLDYETLKNINPGLIYVSIKGYGPGPYSNRNSLDYPIEVETGVAYMTGLENRPLRLGGSIIDIGAALFGVIGALNAMLIRNQTGKGTKIEIGLFEVGLFFMGQHIVTYQINNEPLKPLNEEGFAWGIYDFFETKDAKKIFIGITTDSQWKKFCIEFNFEYCSEPSFEKNEDRHIKRNILIPKLQEFFRNYTYEELVQKLNKANISYAKFNRPWDLLNDEHAKLKLISYFYKGYNLKAPVPPIGFKLVNDPPELGIDTENILKSLGYGDNEIQEFRKNNVI
jgi:crotonobetainyl-CoA:carnitine CoA-transferase CaiB-like acyl-CoA transferase